MMCLYFGSIYLIFLRWVVSGIYVFIKIWQAAFKMSCLITIFISQFFCQLVIISYSTVTITFTTICDKAMDNEIGNWNSMLLFFLLLYFTLDVTWTRLCIFLKKKKTYLMFPFFSDGLFSTQIKLKIEPNFIIYTYIVL